MEEDKTTTTTTEMNQKLIDSFLEITSSSREEAAFFLESHQWDLDAAVTTFLDNDAAATAVSDLPTTASNPNRPPPSSIAAAASPSPAYSPEYSPSETSPSRSRSPSPPSRAAPYSLRSRRSSENRESENPSGSRTTRSRQHAGNIRTFADLNRSPADDDSDSDEAQEYYTGGEKSGMMVQDPRRARDVDALFEQARQSAVERPVESSRSASRSFTGASRLLSGETVSSSAQQQQQEQPQMVMHNITFWRNGFTIDDGPLRRFDDPANAAFMESIANSECPHELEPADKNIRVHVDLVRREEDFIEPPKPKTPFQGVGRTLGASGSGSSTAATETQASSVQMNTAPAPSRGLVVDPAAPTTSVQLRLADGTRLVSRFNNHHTIRDVRGFIDASRPGGSKEYQLLTMGFPPKQLTELDQTIEQAGIANSVVIQKF